MVGDALLQDSLNHSPFNLEARSNAVAQINMFMEKAFTIGRVPSKELIIAIDVPSLESIANIGATVERQGDCLAKRQTEIEMQRHSHLMFRKIGISLLQRAILRSSFFGRWSKRKIVLVKFLLEHRIISLRKIHFVVYSILLLMKSLVLFSIHLVLKDLILLF